MRHLWIVLPIYCGLSLHQTNSSKQLLKQSKSVFLMVCTLYYSFWILVSRLHLNVSKARQIKSKNNLLKKSEIEWDEQSKLKSWMVFAFEPFTVHVLVTQLIHRLHRNENKEAKSQNNITIAPLFSNLEF